MTNHNVATDVRPCVCPPGIRVRYCAEHGWAGWEGTDDEEGKRRAEQYMRDELARLLPVDAAAKALLDFFDEHDVRIPKESLELNAVMELVFVLAAAVRGDPR